MKIVNKSVAALAALMLAGSASVQAQAAVGEATGTGTAAVTVYNTIEITGISPVFFGNLTGAGGTVSISSSSYTSANRCTLGGNLQFLTNDASNMCVAGIFDVRGTGGLQFDTQIDQNVDMGDGVTATLGVVDAPDDANGYGHTPGSNGGNIITASTLSPNGMARMMVHGTVTIPSGAAGDYTGTYNARVNYTGL